MTVPGIDLTMLIEQQRPGWSLAQPFYVDPRIYEHERRGMLARQWMLMGHASELPEPGSYIVREALDESFLVVRGRDQQIRAFFNVCTHRGSRIYESDGRTPAIVCPYHAWSFTLDGKLRRNNDLPPDADPETLGLRPVRTHVMEGLILCTLSDEAMDLGPVEEALRPVLQQHGFATARIAARRSYPTRANWKLVKENFHECYHCRPCHPAYCEVNEHWKTEAHSTPEAAAEWTAKNDAWHAQLQRDGGFDPVVGGAVSTIFQPSDISMFRNFGARRTLIGGGRKTNSRDGAGVAPLMGGFRDYDGGHTSMSIGTLVYARGTCDHIAVFQFLPRSVELTDVIISWLVDGRAADAQVDVARMIWMWDETTIEDTAIIERNAAGVHSSAYRPGPYTRLEGRTRHMASDYLRELAGGHEAAKPRRAMQPSAV
jgi:Rieske 2Fe-2S family protein